jgi:hypothetical protein
METLVELIEQALRRGERLPDGTWPPLPLVWTTARYVECGPLRGVEGVAAHVAGRTWRFVYRDRGPLGRMGDVEVRAEDIAV